jgi:hypothetical protein
MPFKAHRGLAAARIGDALKSDVNHLVHKFSPNGTVPTPMTAVRSEGVRRGGGHIQ